jgi:endonuclease YncB( thermonuclease family)
MLFTSVKADVLGVHDGDTLKVRVTFPIEFGIDLSFTKLLRLADVACPELTQPGGKEATDFVVQWIKDNPGPYTLKFTGGGRDKYDRFLGILISVEGKTLNQALLNADMAQAYKVASLAPARDIPV